MRRFACLLAVAVAVLLLAAGCGGSSGSGGGAASPGSVDGFVTPNTDEPYETGGGDGSGADGSERAEPRGGPGGTADTEEPGERPGADREIKPPRNNDDADADG